MWRAFKSFKCFDKPRFSPSHDGAVDKLLDIHPSGSCVHNITREETDAEPISLSKSELLSVSSTPPRVQEQVLRGGDMKTFSV